MLLIFITNADMIMIFIMYKATSSRDILCEGRDLQLKKNRFISQRKKSIYQLTNSSKVLTPIMGQITPFSTKIKDPDFAAYQETRMSMQQGSLVLGHNIFSCCNKLQYVASVGS